MSNKASKESHNKLMSFIVRKNAVMAAPTFVCACLLAGALCFSQPAGTWHPELTMFLVARWHVASRGRI